MNASVEDRRNFHDNDMEVVLERLGPINHIGNRFELIGDDVVVTAL